MSGVNINIPVFLKHYEFQWNHINPIHLTLDKWSRVTLFAVKQTALCPPPSSHDPLAGKHSSAFLKGKTIGFVGFADFKLFTVFHFWTNFPFVWWLISIFAFFSCADFDCNKHNWLCLISKSNETTCINKINFWLRDPPCFCISSMALKGTFAHATDVKWVFSCQGYIQVFFVTVAPLKSSKDRHVNLGLVLRVYPNKALNFGRERNFANENLTYNIDFYAPVPNSSFVKKKYIYKLLFW